MTNGKWESEERYPDEGGFVEKDEILKIIWNENHAKKNMIIMRLNALVSAENSVTDKKIKLYKMQTIKILRMISMRKEVPDLKTFEH